MSSFSTKNLIKLIISIIYQKNNQLRGLLSNNTIHGKLVTLLAREEKTTIINKAKMKSIHSSLRTTLFTLFIVILSFDLSSQDNKGNPLPHFLFPSFKEGLVIMKEGENFSTLLNYNMVDEKMITELNGTYRYSKNPQLIDSIHLENRVFVPVENAFYEILSSGSVTFFLQNRSYYTPKGADVGYGVKSQSVGPTRHRRFELTKVIYQYAEVAYIDLPPNVEITPASVFWVRKNDKLEKFSTERQFLNIFPAYEPELKKYIKKENINIKSREDVIRLGNYCNEIIKTRE